MEGGFCVLTILPSPIIIYGTNMLFTLHIRLQKIYANARQKLDDRYKTKEEITGKKLDS